MAKERGLVAVIDGGGRGSVLMDAYLQSPHVTGGLAIPGNDMMKVGTTKPVETFPQLKTTSVDEIVKICQERGVVLVDVAQDNAVAAGVANAIRAEQIRVIGPNSNTGEIESNKVYARELGRKIGLPQPGFVTFSSPEEGKRWLAGQPNMRRFVKAAFLAEGKGALSADDNIDAARRIDELAKLKGAGDIYSKTSFAYLIEERIEGDDEVAEEFSLFTLNGQYVGHAQDHKLSGNFDEGENTGGMGCVSPSLVLTPEFKNEALIKIIQPVLEALAEEGRPYNGVLYLGGMIIRKGGKQTIMIVEWNARWGDPEAEVIIPSIKEDFFELMYTASEGKTLGRDIKFDCLVKVAVAGASRGYPGNYEAVKGKRIYGLDEAMNVPGVRIFGAGIKVVDDKYYAAGGRLFYIVGEGIDVIQARQRAYEAISLVSIEGNNLHYRTDIGWRDVARLRG